MQCENIFSSFKTWSCYTCTLVGNLPKNVSREFSMSQFTYYIHALCGCSSMGNWTRCKKFKDDRPLLPKKYIYTNLNISSWWFWLAMTQKMWIFMLLSMNWYYFNFIYVVSNISRFVLEYEQPCGCQE